MSYQFYTPGFMDTAAYWDFFRRENAANAGSSAFHNFFSRLAEKNTLTLQALFAKAFPEYDVMLRYLRGQVLPWADYEDYDRLWNAYPGRLTIYLPQLLGERLQDSPEEQLSLVEKIRLWRDHLENMMGKDGESGDEQNVSSYTEQFLKSYSVFLDNQGNIVKYLIWSEWEEEEEVNREEEEKEEDEKEKRKAEEEEDVYDGWKPEDAENQEEADIRARLTDQHLLGLLAVIFFDGEKEHRRSRRKSGMTVTHRRTDPKFVKYIFWKP